MKKQLTAFFMLAAFAANSQTLFTYGKESVSSDEFLRAFKKNNNGAGDEKALKEYLDLYIASRLKIKEAKEKSYDTLPQLQSDLANLRQQILPSYLNDKESLDRLVKEAFTRSQKDIHVAHIFIALTKNGVTDTVAAAKRRNELLGKLAKGLKFDEAAKQFSDDPSAQANGGDIGWLTVFSLPYEMESVVYATPAGKLSEVFQSRNGYHIFKNLGERKAVGRMKAAQILIAFPPGADDITKTGLKKKVDSLYKRLLAGDDFGKLATSFSNDVISSASNGQMSEFGLGEFDPVFEQAAFSLVKDGNISRPFLTSHGYHIVKRMRVMPVATSFTTEAADNVRRQVEGSDRMEMTKTILAQKVMKQAGFKKVLASNNDLWVFSDSALNYIPTQYKVNINSATPLFKIGKLTLSASDWLTYARTYRTKADGSGVKPYTQLWDGFIQASALKYYEDHMEDFNQDFRRQITEFAEGNLFFEIMQRKIWTPAQTDTVALANYYQKNKNRYFWKESADAVLFYAADVSAANEAYKSLQKMPANWKATLSNYSEQITADSNRFELPQIPKPENAKLMPGSLTAPVANKADNTASFAYIIQLHSKAEPRNFNDARGLVINDYQAELEKEWVSELKKKYPVTVNENAWQEVIKKANKD